MQIPSARFISKFALALLTLFVFSACDLVNPRSIPDVITGNPGVNEPLPSFPTSASQNGHRMTQAIREENNCQTQELSDNTTNVTCNQKITDSVDWYYDSDGRVERAVQTERIDHRRVGPVSFNRYYFYTDADATPNDDAVVRIATGNGDGPGNFHSISEFVYDAQGKLVTEYICEISPVAATIFDVPTTCDKSSASQVYNYAYNTSGYLYRKEFDVDNNNEIDHQFIYSYSASSPGQLSTWQVDDYYDGYIDARSTYRYDTTSGLATSGAIATDLRGIINHAKNFSVSYSRDASQNNAVVRECFFAPGTPLPCIDADTDGDGDIDKDDLTFYHRWTYTWEPGDCWTGMMDDIDPDTRTIDYLCRQL